jgi:hypothetical protein
VQTFSSVNNEKTRSETIDCLSKYLHSRRESSFSRKMWFRGVAIFVLLSVSFVSMEAIEATSGVDVTLCDENIGRMLVMRTPGGGKEEVDTRDSRYTFVVFDLECGKNEYPRSLKPYLYPDDDWEFSVRRILKLVTVGDENFIF